MSAADKIAEARALIEPLTGHTPGPWMQDGIAIAHPSEPNGYPLDVCLMGEPLHFAGDVRPMLQNHEANARLIAAAPALRDTVAALADLADAQAQENAKLRSVLERIASHNVPADDRFNGKLCGHGRSMDEDCNLCTAAYARAALGDAP